MNEVIASTRHWIRNRRRASIAVAAVVLALFALTVWVATGSYPVMIVNGTFIPSSRFEKNYASAAILHANQLKINAGDAAAVEGLQRVTTADLGAGVLDTLVAATLVEHAAKQVAGRELAGLVSSKLSGYATDAQIEQGVETLYGMKYADFQKEVLVPAAERDILAGRLYMEGKDYDEWLASTRRSAKVYILSSRFGWDGEKVVAN
jgi:hypothetical protein